MIGGLTSRRVPALLATVRDRTPWDSTVPVREGQWRTLVSGLFAADILMLAVAVAGADLLRLATDGISPLELIPGLHTLASILVFPVLLGLFKLSGLYERDTILAGTREYAQVAHASTYGVLIALGVSYLAGNSQLVSRAWLIMVWALCIGAVSLGRFAVRRVVRRLRSQGLLRTRIAIVGASSFGVTIAEQLRSAPDEGLDVVGFLDEYIPLGQPLLDDIKVIGRPADLLRNQAYPMADEFVLIPQALPHERQEEISRLMAAQNKPVLRMAVSSSDLLTHGVRVTERGNVHLVTVQRARLLGFESLWKRTFDVIGASLAIVLLTPVAALMLVRHIAKRPLLQSHLVISPNGQTRLWLFDKSVATGPLLRGLPALVGVVRGQFSLIGPRPIIFDASSPDPQSSGLTAIRPGLTGPWRLSGPGASLAEQAVKDLTYVRNYTIWEDVRILCQSIQYLLNGRLSTLLGRWDAPAVCASEIRSPALFDPQVA